jgi:hypothetical protein
MLCYEVSEEVQLLCRDELRIFVRAIEARGTSSRGRRGGSLHLLAPREMAGRSPAVLWSLAHEFGGDVEGGVATLLRDGDGDAE